MIIINKRALILHGYGQSAEIAEKKWSVIFRKIGIQPSYLDAPINVINKDNQPTKGWFLWSGTKSIYTVDKYLHVEESLLYVYQYIVDKGSFDIIIVDRYKLSLTHLIIISSYEPLDLEWKIQNIPKCKVLLICGKRKPTEMEHLRIWR